MIKANIGLIIGGLAPALIWAVGNIFQKLSNKSGLNLKAYLLFISMGVLFSSLLSLFFIHDKAFSLKGALFAFLQGICFSCGILLFALGIIKFKIPLSQLSPLAATITLFTVILALIIFREYKEVNTIKLIIGTVLIVAGSIVVGSS